MWLLAHPVLGVVAAVVFAVALVGLVDFIDDCAARARKLGGGGHVPSVESRWQPTPGRGTDGPVAAEPPREWTIARTSEYADLDALIDEVTR